MWWSDTTATRWVACHSIRRRHSLTTEYSLPICNEWAELRAALACTAPARLMTRSTQCSAAGTGITSVWVDNVLENLLSLETYGSCSADMWPWMASEFDGRGVEEIVHRDSGRHPRQDGERAIASGVRFRRQFERVEPISQRWLYAYIFFFLFNYFLRLLTWLGSSRVVSPRSSRNLWLKFHYWVSLFKLCKELLCEEKWGRD